jgi:hypothetical protein
MLSDAKIWIKITIITAMSVILVGTSLTLWNLHNMNDLVHLAERQELQGYVHNVTTRIRKISS